MSSALETQMEQGNIASGSLYGQGGALARAATPAEEAATRWYRAKDALERAMVASQQATACASQCSAEEAEAWEGLQAMAGRGPKSADQDTGVAKPYPYRDPSRR